MSYKTHKLETIAIHGSMDHESGSRSVVPPIDVSTNYVHDERGYQEGDFIYTRYENPNRLQLEQVLAHLEGGASCAAFSSGLAALSAVFQALEAGSHVLLPGNIYHGTRSMLQKFGNKWGIECSFTDMTDLDQVESDCRKNTRLIFVETPSNPLMQITDVEKMCLFARKKGVKVCVDNTWPTPLNLNPIYFGADLVMHSTTKYLGGHSDILGGAVISKEKDEFFERIREIQRSQGAVPSPRDCWLLTRSIRSFPYRMRAHNANAMEVAKYLNDHPKIKEVYYPGLPTHPGHDIARSQMSGFGGMISFLYDGTAEETLSVVAKSEIITRATSLGGVESLWEHRRSSEREGSTTPDNLIRLSVGLEHIDDLIADLEQALGS